MKNTKNLVITALLTALVCVATMIIRIPTPTMGYVNLGDGFVLLSSLLLGPVLGTLAAAFGSALADLFAGYLVYVPATFIIKGLVALVAVLVFRKLPASLNVVAKTIIAGICGEFFMVLGYFLFEIFMLAYSNGGALSSTTLAAGAIASLAGVVPNITQAVFGVAISTLLYPFLKKLAVGLLDIK